MLPNLYTFFENPQWMPVATPNPTVGPKPLVNLSYPSRSMEEWVAKVICLVILLILTMTFGLLPRLISTAGNEMWLSIANCVAGTSPNPNYILTPPPLVVFLPLPPQFCCCYFSLCQSFLASPLSHFGLKWANGLTPSPINTPKIIRSGGATLYIIYIFYLFFTNWRPHCSQVVFC